MNFTFISHQNIFSKDRESRGSPSWWWFSPSFSWVRRFFVFSIFCSCGG
jgi:hypothetical protein